MLGALIGCGYPDYSGFDKVRGADASDDQAVAPDVPVDVATDVEAGEEADVQTDVVQDVAVEADAALDADLDAGTDAEEEAGDAGPCTTDDDCQNHPAGPFCDEPSGLCGACDLTDDQCPQGEYCSSSTLACEVGCKSDEDCTSGELDGGKEDPDADADGSVPEAGSSEAGSLACDLATHECVGCAIDDDCPLGTLCESPACVAGCTETHPCPSGRDCCSGQCVSFGSDPLHCGDCDTVCNTAPHAQVGCSSGQCAISTCDAGWADCDGAVDNGCEVAIGSQLQNCGACGASCAFANGIAQCIGGSCNFVSCESGFADCDLDLATGCEIDTTSDGSNCGTCGTVCAALPHATPGCIGSACEIAACDPGFADCNATPSDGCETAIANNVANCGGCGVACSLLHANAACSTGVCTVASCAPNYANCDGQDANGCEVNIAQDTNFCGSCAISCSFTNASSVCDQGSCQLGTCSAGWGNCDTLASTGCETPLSSDPANCGTCGSVCSAPHGVPACTNASCEIQECSNGWGDCNGLVADGCEAPLTTATNCGACGSACAPPNGAGVCNSGICTIVSCDAGYADCDLNAMNGCEVNTDTSVNHCGGCGAACPTSGCTPKCEAGSCGCSTCTEPGTADCDGILVNGCEVDTTSDAGNCGGCGVVCSAPYGVPACVGSACAIASCNAGRGDCNGVATDGCETDLRTLTNCATCGTSCSLPHGTESCSTGVCQLTSCDTDYGNCDNDDANGCEANLQTDPLHCGSCPLACSVPHASPACTSGACMIGTCDGGWSNCDADQANGCETSTGTDVTNCGSCGFTCGTANGTPSCGAGECSITCNTGYANCDDTTANGCETNTTNDVNNCDGCGNVCPAIPHGTAGCIASACGVATCDTGYHKSGGTCVPDVEICGNGMDDDLDAKIDCFDADCLTDATCAGVCSNAATVACDSYVTTQNSGAAGSTQRIAPPAYSCVAGDFAGPEYAYKFTGAADQDVFVEAYGLSGDLGVFLVETPTGEQCTASTSCLTYGNQHADGRPEALGFTAQAGRDYYVVVDGASAQDYALSVQCSTAGGCFPARPIAAGMSFAATNGSGANVTPNLVPKYSCVSYSETGPEAAWIFTPTVAGTYRVDVTGLSDDCDLWVTSANNCDGTCLTSTSYSSNLNKQSEQVDFTAQAHRSYYILVDGYAGNVCNFTISLTQL